MITRRFLLLSTILPVFALAAARAHAGDEGLYQDVFDPNSSFVRVLAPGQTFASINGTNISDFASGLSTYVNVMPGTVPVALSENALDVEVAPSRHYTVVSIPGADPEVIEDSLVLSPAKADVSLFNLTALEDIDLYVPLAKAVAIAAVDSTHAKSVALKAPLTLDFDLMAGETQLTSVTGVELKRKSGVTIVLSEAGGEYAAQAVPNTYRK